MDQDDETSGAWISDWLERLDTFIKRQAPNMRGVAAEDVLRWRAAVDTIAVSVRTMVAKHDETLRALDEEKAKTARLTRTLHEAIKPHSVLFHGLVESLREHAQRAARDGFPDVAKRYDDWAAGVDGLACAFAEEQITTSHLTHSLHAAKALADSEGTRAVMWQRRAVTLRKTLETVRNNHGRFTGDAWAEVDELLAKSYGQFTENEVPGNTHGPTYEDGPDSEGFSGPRPWNGFKKGETPEPMDSFSTDV